MIEDFGIAKLTFLSTYKVFSQIHYIITEAYPDIGKATSMHYGIVPDL